MTDTSRPSPNLIVIEGGGRPAPHWTRLPSVIVGRSPFSRDDSFSYRISQRDLVRSIEQGLRQPVFAAWAGICGQLPPVPGIARISGQLEDRPLLSIYNAHACFRGLMRPFGDDKRGFDRFVFITRPKFTVSYQPSMTCVATLERLPQDVLFAIYCRLDFPCSVGNSRKLDLRPTSGLITHWQFVEADPTNADLPVAFRDRYRMRMW